MSDGDYVIHTYPSDDWGDHDQDCNVLEIMHSPAGDWHIRTVALADPHNLSEKGFPPLLGPWVRIRTSGQWQWSHGDQEKGLEPVANLAADLYRTLGLRDPNCPKLPGEEAAPTEKEET